MFWAWALPIIAVVLLVIGFWAAYVGARRRREYRLGPEDLRRSDDTPRHPPEDTTGGWV